MTKNIDTRARSYLAGYIGLGGSADLARRRCLGWADRQDEGRSAALVALSAAAREFGAHKLAQLFAADSV